MLRKLSSINDENCTNLAQYIFARTIKSLKNAGKADKFARLFANVIKLIRTMTPESKSKYSKLYKQLLIVRQVFRWQGLYQAVLQFSNKGQDMYRLSNINNLVWIALEMIGDLFDRCMFFIEIVLDMKKYEKVYNWLQKMESNCYFIQCFTQLIFHLRTFNKVWHEGNRNKIKTKILKIIKYVLDSLTSHNKFSLRLFEIGAERAAVIGIASSIIGIYELMTS